MTKRGKMDFFAMLVWLLLIGVIAAIVGICVGKLKAVNDPANKQNYWMENMYGYRSDMERADERLEQGRWEDARQGYREALSLNSANQVSIVLHDRIARAHHREGRARLEQGDYAGAISALRSASQAVADTGARATNVRNFDNNYRDEVTTRDQVTDALVEALVAEGVRRRDEETNFDAAESCLVEARSLGPSHFGACTELIDLHRQTRQVSSLLEAMRHFLDHFPGPQAQGYDQLASQNPEYAARWTNTAQSHSQIQNHVLQSYDITQWWPMVDGAIFNFHIEYVSIETGITPGPPFTRTMRVPQPGVAHLATTPGQPEITLRWQNVPGIGECLVEEWTANFPGRRESRFFNLLPRNAQMGMQWQNPDGRTYRIVDLVSHPQFGFVLVISGYDFCDIEIAYGVGRISPSPREEGMGERLDSVTLPGEM